MSDWMKDFKEREETNNKTKKEVTEKILDLLKGVDRVGCLPTILANIFEYIEAPAGTDEIHGFNNLMVSWGLETYAGRKISSLSQNLLALYSYCVDEEYTEDNPWEWGGGDRQVCYIPNDKKILLFENQNIQFVVVFDGIKMHVREVFKSLIDNDDNSFYSFKGQYFNSVTDLREGLKSEKGLEIALCNLTGKYHRFSNSIEGNEYPDKIDLDNMKKFDFGEGCSAFRYGDNRDNGYLMSVYNSSYSSIDGKCELNDLRRADYSFSDMTGACMEIPKAYLKALKREETVSKLLKKENGG